MGGENRVLRRVSVEDQDVLPSEYGLSLRVEVVEPNATLEHTARLRVTLTNGRDREVTTSAEHRPPLPARESTETDPGLVLVETGRPTVDPRPEPVSPGNWKLKRDPGGALYLELANLDPGERLSRDCTVWGMPTNSEDSLPPGTYRFEGTYEESGTGDRPVFRWGFDLRVTD